jgi:hypothetical protein
MHWAQNATLLDRHYRPVNLLNLTQQHERPASSSAANEVLGGGSMTFSLLTSMQHGENRRRDMIRGSGFDVDGRSQARIW